MYVIMILLVLLFHLGMVEQIEPQEEQQQTFQQQKGILLFFAAF
jgi:hypothetical protein